MHNISTLTLSPLFNFFSSSSSSSEKKRRVLFIVRPSFESSFLTNLGNVRVSEQIDALEIMGINTKAYLVLPKIVAALLMIPCLITLAAFLGIFGGRTAADLSNIVAADIFDIGLRTNFSPFNIGFALSKAYTFAFIVSSVPAYYGYYVTGGSLEIGRSSTTSVVVSCILVLIADYALAALLL